VDPSFIANQKLTDPEYRTLAISLFNHEAVQEVFQKNSSLFRRKLFIRLLALRCKWFATYADYNEKLYREATGDNDWHAVRLRDTLQQFPLAELFVMLLKEITALCKEGAQTRVDIKKVEAGEEVPYYFACTLLEPPDFSCLHFHCMKYGEDGNPPVLRNRTLGFWDALATPHKLRQELAPALDLHETSRMQRIVAQQKYV